MSNYIVIVLYEEVDVYIREFKQNNPFKEMGKRQRDEGMRRKGKFASLIGGVCVSLSVAMDGHSNYVKGV